jgi:hypothetical protein
MLGEEISLFILVSDLSLSQGSALDLPTAKDTPEGINTRHQRFGYNVRRIVAATKNIPKPSMNIDTPEGSPLPNTSFAVLTRRKAEGTCRKDPGI